MITDTALRESLPRSINFSERVSYFTRETLQCENSPTRQSAATSKLEWWSKELRCKSTEIIDLRCVEFNLTAARVLDLIGLSTRELTLILAGDCHWIQVFDEIWSLSCEGPDGICPQLSSTKITAFCGPWLAWARRRIVENIHKLQMIDRSLVESTVAIEPVLLSLGDRFLQMVIRTFALELNVARIRGELKASTSEGRFDEFCALLATRERTLRLLVEYPVLARILTEETIRAVEATNEFLSRLSQDWPVLTSTFSHERSSLGPLTTVHPGMGDYHKSGRSVCVAQFKSGRKVVYKPRPLVVDTCFFDLLQELEGSDWSFLRPKRPSIIERDEYGWCEYIEFAECQDRAGVNRFYERAGYLLAVAYALVANDLHFENLIAHADSPVPVDLECLFNSALEIATENGNPLASAYWNTILACGLLPGPRLRLDAPDYSGLGMLEGTVLSANMVLSWDDAGLDSARLVRRRIPVDRERTNLPRFHGQSFGSHLFTDSLVEGFRRCCLALNARPDILSTKTWERFFSQRYRVVLRPTIRYNILLQESYHPNVLRDAMDREIVFDGLWRDLSLLDWRCQLIRSERDDLWSGDIPLFKIHPTANSVHDSKGRVRVSLHGRTPQAVAECHVRQLMHTDGMREAWVIANACTCASSQDVLYNLLRRPPWKPSKCDSGAGHDIAAIIADIAERVASLAFCHDEGVFWIDTIDASNTKTTGFFAGPTGIDLYSGLSGYLLFFGEVERVLQLEKYEEIIVRLERTIFAALNQSKNKDYVTGGGFSGEVSSLFALTQRLRHEPGEFARIACARVLDLIEQNLHRDTVYDIIAGSAGIICSLLEYSWWSHDTRAIDLAERCGDHLIANATEQPQGLAWLTLPDCPPLGGFAHGTAGIAYSLFRLFVATGQARFRAAAERALAYDRATYSEALGNWRDLRRWAPSEDCVAWCHGAVGVGLSRIGLKRLGADDDHLEQEIAQAVCKIVYAQCTNHSLCHGGFGSLEFLSEVKPLVGERTLQQKIDDYMEDRLYELKIGGMYTDSGTETLNLMLGITGVAYTLLRQLDASAPSVLLLGSDATIRKSNCAGAPAYAGR